jgi:hypothetical protein
MEGSRFLRYERELRSITGAETARGPGPRAGMPASQATPQVKSAQSVFR